MAVTQLALVGFRWPAATLLSVKAHVKAHVSLDAELLTPTALHVH